MKKKILVLTGSPRVGGNNDLLAEAFMKGAMVAGHDVSRFDAGRKNIKGYKACDTCFSKGIACSFDEDFNLLASMLESADALVLVTPMYWFSFTAEIKAAIDKLYAFIIGERPLKIRECMLLTCAETEDIDDFDGITATYKRIINYQKWTDRGILTVPGVNARGDIKNTPALAEAEKLGESF